MTPGAGDPADKDPSMDDILASIRRIMLDEQARLQEGPAGALGTRATGQSTRTETVLILDASMAVEGMPQEALPETIEGGMLPEGATPPGDEDTLIHGLPRASHAPAVEELAPLPEVAPRDAAIVDGPVPMAQEADASAQRTVPGAVIGAVTGVGADAPAAEPLMVTSQAIEALLAPAAAAAAAASVDALLKQLSEDRLALLKPTTMAASPTIEDVVRSELRPLLKTWLDEHLPTLVERLVRAEINRLIGRSGL